MKAFQVQLLALSKKNDTKNTQKKIATPCSMLKLKNVPGAVSGALRKDARPKTHEKNATRTPFSVLKLKSVPV